MTLQTLMMGKKEYVVIERKEFDRLAAKAGEPDSLPALPKADAEGNVPAVAYGRVLLARKLITARREAGLAQAELARRAGIRVETLNRLEKGRHNPDEATFNKLEAVLRKQGVRI
jgi:DNA-binding XRE family transcriptional regulator